MYPECQYTIDIINPTFLRLRPARKLAMYRLNFWQELINGNNPNHAGGVTQRTLTRPQLGSILGVNKCLYLFIILSIPLFLKLCGLKWR